MISNIIIAQSKGNNDSSANNNSPHDKVESKNIKAIPKQNSKNDNDVLKNQKEDPLLEYISSSREITQKEVNDAPLLIIDEDSNGTLFNKTQVKINAAGLIGGRNAKDGVAIFGQANAIINDKFKADFELQFKDPLPYPYIFAIYYQRDTKNYYIRGYSGKSSDNRILFVKLSGNYSLTIRQKEIISAGNVIFQITPLEGNKLEIENLSKKLPNEDKNKRIFDPSETKEITIGRDPKCTFAFPKDKSFSRCQTTFIFEEQENTWRIIDGSKTKSSTNGTWTFGTHSFEIKDQMTVEILTTKVKFTLLENDK